MTTDLAKHVSELRIANTHEHQFTEQQFLDEPLDIIRALLDNYVMADLDRAFKGRDVNGDAKYAMLRLQVAF